MFMFGGWDYGSVLTMVDSLVYDRHYGGFFDILNNFTVKELMEVFTIIRNKENEKNLQETMIQGSKDVVDVPTEGLSQEVLDFLMNG